MKIHTNQYWLLFIACYYQGRKLQISTQFPTLSVSYNCFHVQWLTKKKTNGFDRIEALIQIVKNVMVLTATLPDASSEPCRFYNNAISSIDEGMQNMPCKTWKHIGILNQVEHFNWDAWLGASASDYTNKQSAISNHLFIH